MRVRLTMQASAPGCSIPSVMYTIRRQCLVSLTQDCRLVAGCRFRDKRQLKRRLDPALPRQYILCTLQTDQG
jgi:hypothetical protein